MKKLLFILIGASFLLAACGVFVEKRRYNKGFHVSWNSKKLNKGKEKQEKDQIAAAEDNDLPSLAIAPLKESEGEQSITYSNIIVPEEDPYFIQPHPITPGVTQESYDELVIDQEAKEQERELVALASKSEEINRTELNWSILSLLGIISLGGLATVRLSKNRTLRVTRWASKNKKASKVIITGGQVLLAASGYYVGGELFEMGYDVSEAQKYIGAGLGFGAAGFLMYKEKISSALISMKSFFQSKFAHILIGASLFGAFLTFGNGDNTISYLGTTEKVETQTTATSQTSDDTYVAAKQSNSRGNAGRIAGAIILSILVLAITAIFACALACSDQGLAAIAVLAVGLAGCVLIIVGMTRGFGGSSRYSD